MQNNSLSDKRVGEKRVSENSCIRSDALRDRFNLRVKANAAGRLLILLYRTVVIIRGLSPPAVK